jgi:predicted transcriptional regulator
MEALATTTPQIVITGPEVRASLPRWAKDFNATIDPLSEFTQRSALPPVTLISASSPRRLLDTTALVRHLSERISESRQFSVVLFLFHKTVERARADQVELLQSLPRSLLVDVDLTFGRDSVESSLHEALAKYLAWSDTAEAPGLDSLATATKALAATHDLRSGSGKLSAKKVAAAFGVTQSKVAQWMGRSRQSISKTPEAEDLQKPLATLERIARLRAVITDAQFRAWLNMENAELGDERPLDLIAAGRARVVAELVEDMLTGSPA